MNNHLIRRFELELHVADKESGRVLQDEILFTYKEQLINLIANRFDKLIGPDEYLTIDSLVVDAGKLAFNQWSEQLLLQLGDALEVQLRKLIEQARQQPGEAVSLNESDTAGGTLQITVQLKTASYSKQQLLWQLLITGILPWQGSSTISIEQLVRELHAAGELTGVLQALLQQKKGIGFLRLVKQLRQETLLLLLKNEKLKSFAQVIYRQIQLLAGQAAAESFMAAVLQVAAAEKETTSNLISVLMLQDLHTDQQFRPALAALLLLTSKTFAVGELHPEKFIQFSNGDTDIEKFASSNVAIEQFINAKNEVVQFINGKIDFAAFIKSNAEFVEYINGKIDLVQFVSRNTGFVQFIRKNIDFIKFIKADTELIRLILLDEQQQQAIIEKSTRLIDKDVAGEVLADRQSTPADITELPDDQLIIANAGLVLLHPFISTFLSRTGHIENRVFINDRAREEAAVLLQLLVTGMPSLAELSGEAEETWFEEHQLLLNKILVGLPIETPLPGLSTFPPEALEAYAAEADKALQHAINTWSLLSRTTTAAFREMFLKHEGRISPGRGGWDLQIERDSFDVLIDKLPWPISIVRFPWSEKVIYVTW
jgi:Contractile injection system tape measure protein